jgi:hypothetical protein
MRQGTPLANPPLRSVGFLKEKASTSEFSGRGYHPDWPAVFPGASFTAQASLIAQITILPGKTDSVKKNRGLQR